MWVQKAADLYLRSPSVQECLKICGSAKEVAIMIIECPVRWLSSTLGSQILFHHDGQNRNSRATSTSHFVYVAHFQSSLTTRLPPSKRCTISHFQPNSLVCSSHADVKKLHREEKELEQSLLCLLLCKKKNNMLIAD